jgi:peptide/nickel transport system substrate-binding protein
MMIKQLELVTVPDLTSRVLQLTTGAIDWAFDLPFSATPNLPKEVTPILHPLGGTFHITVNLERPGPLQDVNVRRAISLAIDREAVNQKAFFGASPPVSSMLYSGIPEQKPMLPNDGKRDVEAARKLLAETPHAGGFQFNLLTWGARPGWKEATLVIAEHLKEIGITANIEPVEDAVIVDRAKSRTFDAMWTGIVQPPLFVLKIAYTPGSFWCDAAAYNNPKVTALLDKAQTELDSARRIALMNEAEKIGIDDMPHIPICERTLLMGTRVKDDILAVVKRENYIRAKTVAEMKA